MTSPSKFTSVQDLMEEILQIQREKSKDTDVIERVQEIIQKSNKLVENSESPNEIIIDAKILHTGAQVVNSKISSFDTNLTSFNEEEYKRGIVTYLRNNSNGLSFEKSWKCFAPITYHLFHKSDPPTFMLGSFSLDPAPSKEKAKPERTKKILESKTKLCHASESSQKEGETVEENIYEHILKSLMRCYKSNDKKPLNFIDFIMNPDSYWHSVENIFYFSFLVRDGRVNMFLNEKGLPVVEPVLRNDSLEKSLDKSGSQFSFALSKNQWRDCVEKFNITSPKIRPFHKS